MSATKLQTQLNGPRRLLWLRLTWYYFSMTSELTAGQAQSEITDN